MLLKICHYNCCESLLKYVLEVVVIRLWYMCEMKSIALNFVRWFLKNNSCDLLNEVVIRCEIVATNYLYSFIWRNFMIKYCIIICWMNVVNECVEWICWWNMWWKCVEELLWWSCDEVAMKLWWSSISKLLWEFVMRLLWWSIVS